MRRKRIGSRRETEMVVEKELEDEEEKNRE